MIRAQHFVSISGGKDSQAVACLMVERAQRRDFGNMPPRFLFADTGNEEQITLDHVAYLSDWLFGQLGQTVETVTAYSVPGLIDGVAFERKRGVMRTEWPKEKRIKRHSEPCRARRRLMPAADWLAKCDCPVVISPAVPDNLIEQAIAALQPTGVAFLDMAMIHGRFPGAKSRFCTDELKLAPMRIIKDQTWAAGINTVEHIGERAQESAARAKKPVLQSSKQGGPDRWARAWLYRPILHLLHGDVFSISRRHGLKDNPLYRQGMGRVGCMPCIMVKKAEIRKIAQRFPQHIDRLEQWEAIVGAVSRRTVIGGASASFMPADKVPGDLADHSRGTIRKVVEWSQTTRGGEHYDMMLAIEQAEADQFGLMCDSEYGLCE